ncbi:Dabb family protein [Flavobacterium faecale]|uniref:Dabb family protein n=1 Tax=Flavobacterium faecale TaxID=1355330 RepID=UPI003AAF8518
MIHHSVYFKFKIGLSTLETQDFFKAANLLSAIPGVQNFEVVKEISPKNDFEFGLSMVFENAKVYENYNLHPHHVSFVQEYWLQMVEDFLEIDYEAIVG